MARTREVIHAVDWADVEIVERPENVGNATNVTDAVNRVFEHYDRLVVVEDDVFVHPAFGRFVTAALEHYADEPRVATVTGMRMPFPRRATRTTRSRSSGTRAWAPASGAAPGRRSSSTRTGCGSGC